MLTARTALLVVLVGSAAIIAMALIFQYVGHLAPCELCLYERWPYYAAMPVAALALRPGPRADLLLAAVLLAAIFIASGALAFYHVGVEQHVFAGPTACTGTGGAAKTLDELRTLLAGQQPVRCDVPQWSLFGVTLAGLNLVASLALAAASLAGWRAACAGRAA